jgi:uncharacterized membrane protein (UPF0127 family)
MKWVFAALVALLLAGTASGNEQLDAAFSKDVLVVEASDYGCFRFDVYLALTGAQHSRGLMFVRDLPETTGMLFVYPGDYVLSMWMKNTYISLDMVFARPDGTVINVIRNTEPRSLKSLRSSEVAAFALELNAGITERLAIDENSRIYWEPAHGSDE